MFDSPKEAELEQQSLVKATELAAVERSAAKHKLVMEDHFEYERTKTETLVQQKHREIEAETETQIAEEKARENR